MSRLEGLLTDVCMASMCSREMVVLTGCECARRGESSGQLSVSRVVEWEGMRKVGWPCQPPRRFQVCTTRAFTYLERSRQT